LVCNFNKSSHEKPSLLKHFDIVLLFHELGHGIHDLVAKTRYARFHGTNLVVDFGEAPSQMLENCCWIPSVLKSLSKHYSHLSPEFLELWKKQAGVDAAQPAEQIPDEMVQDLLKTRHITFGPLFYLGQLHFAMFDMRVHQPASHEAIKGLDLSVEWNSLRKNLCLMDGAEVLGHNDDWGHGYAHFGHLVGSDYDSAFYSYLL
jgi:metallopeptidase MepB